MKLQRRILLALCAVIGLLLTPAALADAPAELTEAFTAARWNGYAIPEPSWEDGSPIGDSGAAWAVNADGSLAVCVMKSGSRNVFCVLNRSGGRWRLSLSSSSLLRQGSWIPSVFIREDNALEIIYGTRQATDMGRASRMVFVRQSGAWLLESYEYWNGSDTISISVSGNRLVFTQYATGRKTTVTGVVARRLEQIYLSSFPTTAAQARRKLTSPPDIPEFTGALRIPDPLDVQFPANRQYAVYAGPGVEYIRGAGGRALMSSNDWVQVFGREQHADGRFWIMVQYAVSNTHMRIGWIQEDQLPGRQEAFWLNTRWLYQSAVLSTAVVLTDDPLHSRTALTGQLPAGTAVTLLARFGTQWYYVEAETVEGPARGFIPQRSLALSGAAELDEAACRQRGENALKAAYPDFAAAQITSVETRYFEEDAFGAAPKWQFIYHVGSRFYAVEVYAPSGAVMLLSSPATPGNG